MVRPCLPTNTTIITALDTSVMEGGRASSPTSAPSPTDGECDDIPGQLGGTIAAPFGLPSAITTTNAPDTSAIEGGSIVFSTVPSVAAGVLDAPNMKVGEADIVLSTLRPTNLLY